MHGTECDNGCKMLLDQRIGVKLMKNFCFTVDDNIRCFKELTRGDFDSIFEHPYLKVKSVVQTFINVCTTDLTLRYSLIFFMRIMNLTSPK